MAEIKIQKLAGVMGWPIHHSLSPQLHGFWLSKYGINGAYVPLAVSLKNIEDIMIKKNIMPGSDLAKKIFS